MPIIFVCESCGLEIKATVDQALACLNEAIGAIGCGGFCSKKGKFRHLEKETGAKGEFRSKQLYAGVHAQEAVQKLKRGRPKSKEK